MASVRSLTANLFKSMLFAMLGFLIPMHGKRILLVATLHMQLVRDGIFREETLEKLNQALKLAKFDDAFKLPALVYGHVWDDRKLQAAIQSAVDGDLRNRPIPYEEARRLSEIVLDVSPEWLRYGRKDDMVNDIVALFYSQSAVPQAA